MTTTNPSLVHQGFGSLEFQIVYKYTAENLPQDGRYAKRSDPEAVMFYRILGIARDIINVERDIRRILRRRSNYQRTIARFLDAGPQDQVLLFSNSEATDRLEHFLDKWSSLVGQLRANLDSHKLAGSWLSVRMEDLGGVYDGEICGARTLSGRPCTMPQGHNRGQADVPENHSG